VASDRSRSASRRTFCAEAWSSQNPGWDVSASSCATRASLASRSKTPRRRPDPLCQVPNGRRVHLVAGLEILEQDRTELDETECRLAPGDDGVHAGAVRVVGTDAAVAVTVEGCGVAACSAVTLAGDEIDKRRFLGLLHESLSLAAGGSSGITRGRGWGTGSRWLDPREVSASIGPEFPLAKGEKLFSCVIRASFWARCSARRRLHTCLARRCVQRAHHDCGGSNPAPVRK